MLVQRVLDGLRQRAELEMARRLVTLRPERSEALLMLSRAAAENASAGRARR